VVSVEISRNLAACTLASSRGSVEHEGGQTVWAEGLALAHQLVHDMAHQIC
jgi:hypothetical protein